MKRILFFLVVSIYLTMSVNAQTNVFPSSGNVGIGTTNITAPLTVQSAPSASAIRIIGREDDYGYLEFLRINGTTVSSAIYSKTDRLTLIDGTGNDVLSLKGGLVGIGTTNPGSSLEISSTFDNILRLRQNEAGEAWNYIEFYNSTARKAFLGTDNSGNFNIGKDLGVGNLLLNYGNVGIGTTTPQNKLDVNGTIRAKEVKVETGWADFVFLPTYKLRPLCEVEEFIKTNGHLPEIPKAEEVQQNGVNLGEMQTKLLQKVEELTLYAIELKKENVEQEKQNSELKKKLAEQDAKYQQLLKMIEELRNK